MNDYASPATQGSIADMLLRACEAEEMRKSLKRFVVNAWRLIDPSPFVDGWVVDAICDHLTALTFGKIRFLLINVPPRHSKSTICSVLWPVWDWLHKPEDKFLCASYGLNLAIRDNLKKRNLIDSRWFQERYGQEFRLQTDRQSIEFVRGKEFTLSPDQNAKRFFMNDRMGYQLAVSVGSTTTGEGGSRLLIDDMHSAFEAHSDAERESANMWFREVWSSRMNDASKDSMIVIGQRIHENDVSGIILSERQDWVYLNLPAEYEPGRRCKTFIGGLPLKEGKVAIPSQSRSNTTHTVEFADGKAISCTCEDFTYRQQPCKHMQKAEPPRSKKEPFWEDPRRIEGELLWPERFNQETLTRYKRDLGALGYAAQYQQSPVPASGSTFRKDNERLFTETFDTYNLHTPRGIRSVAKEACSKFITVDPAISEKESADYTVIGTWALTPFKDLLLLNIRRDHWSHKDQQEEIKEEYEESNAEFVAVETIAYQAALFQDLLDRGIFCRPFIAKRDKVSRASGSGIWHENGKMYFLKNASWLPAYQSEVYKFPKASKDDQVDMTSLAGIVVRSRGPLSDDDADVEVPDPIEGPSSEIPFTVPFVPTADPEAVVDVTPEEKPIDPFEFANQIFGEGW